MSKPSEIILSTEGTCADNRFCFNPGSKPLFKRNWINKHDLFVDIDGRVFALIRCKLGEMFMDAITGSLYNDGVCIASQKLLLREPVRNHERAARILLATQPTK